MQDLVDELKQIELRREELIEAIMPRCFDIAMAISDAKRRPNKYNSLPDTKEQFGYIELDEDDIVVTWHTANWDSGKIYFALDLVGDTEKCEKYVQNIKDKRIAQEKVEAESARHGKIRQLKKLQEELGEDYE